MARTSPAVNGRSTESGASETAELHIQSCCSLHSNFAFREREWVCVWRWMIERERERKDRSNGYCTSYMEMGRRKRKIGDRIEGIMGNSYCNC